ncbi:MAG TPA: sulfatase [Thermoanaerobaculia bacterium]|nr:sulfatase [Thermoanaerobaculia bacterium]
MPVPFAAPMNRMLRSPRPRAASFVLLTGCLLVAGCYRDPEGARRPVIDGLHAPDVLVERREIAHPPSLSGNRFVAGWWPWRSEGRLTLTPLQPARLEIANLAGVERTLVLDLLEAPRPGKRVRVRHGDRDLGAYPLADPLEIPLPADLPPGRVALDLSFDPGSPSVLAGGVRPVLPPGGAKVVGENLGQKGDSIVDVIHRVAPGTTLVGRFIPPTDPRPGQRFELAVERADGTPVRRFVWANSFWSRLRGSRDILLPLRDTEGLIRIRMRARGAGPSGEWRGLALVGPVPSPGGGAVAAAEAAEPAQPAAPLAPTTEPPRLVIVYVMDALRADTPGFMGGPAGISPTVDRLAREGVTLRKHRSVAPNTIPSTKSFFTGRTFVSRGGWTLLPEDGATLAELFKKAGYRTGLFSGNVYVSSAYATDRGFEHVAEEVLIDGYTAAEKPPFNDNAARAHAAALAWLRTLKPGEKAFLYFHTIHPHNPYDPPAPFRSRFTAGIPSAIDGSTETLVDIKHARREASPADQRRLRGLYNGAFSYNDAELGRFLAEVASFWAKPEETFLAVTADHGEELFEHGGVLHGFTLYEEMLRIPMVFWAPGRLRPGTVALPTDSLDLHATLVETGGLQPEKPSAGRPLSQLIRGEAGGYIHFAAASSVKGGMYAAQAGRWKVVWAPRTGMGWGVGDGLGRTRDPEYLFDIQKDPGEKVNLAGRGDMEAAWLRSRLLAWIEAGRQPEEGEKTVEPTDPETLDRLRALGYVN